MNIFATCLNKIKLSTKRFFFPEGYLELYPDIKASGIDPWRHYVLQGKKEGRSNGIIAPPDFFTPEGYIDLYHDVKESGVDPWRHYVLQGKNEGRSNGVDPLFLPIEKQIKLVEGASFFDKDWYTETYHIPRDIDPLEYYLTEGWRENHNPCKTFNTKFYIDTYRDVKEIGVNPLLHYLIYGQYENRLIFNEYNMMKLDAIYSIPKELKKVNDSPIPIVTMSDLSEKSFIILLHEHLGDIIASEPIVRYLSYKYEDFSIYWATKNQYKDVLLYNPFLKGVIVIDDLDEFIAQTYELEKNQYVINIPFNDRPYKNNTLLWKNSRSDVTFKNYFINRGILEAFSTSAGLPPLRCNPIFWKKEAQPDHGVPSRYAVIHCSSNEKRKDWTQNKFYKLTQLLIDNEINVVEIGINSVVNIDNARYYNFCHIHDLQLIADLIGKCDFFVGVDSAFMHIANCFNKKAVAIMGHYANFYRYNPYAGDYAKDINIIRLFPENPTKPACDVSVEAVYNAIKLLGL